MSFGFVFIVDTLLIFANQVGYNIGVLMLKRRINPKIIVALGGTIALSGIFASSFCK